MTRDNIVSVRLTDGERAQLARLGGRPSDVFRRLLREALNPPVAYVVPIAGVGTGTGTVLWADGTCGPNWPAP